ncbi:MAG: hypothetical protein WCP30_11850 [Mycobacteriaceae bacterium]
MTESRRRTAATWGLIVASAAGAVGVSALAHSELTADDATFVDSAGPTGGVFEAPAITTTTTAPPGVNGAPVKRTSAGAGTHTKAHGS